MYRSLCRSTQNPFFTCRILNGLLQFSYFFTLLLITGLLDKAPCIINLIFFALKNTFKYVLHASYRHNNKMCECFGLRKVDALKINKPTRSIYKVYYLTCHLWTDAIRPLLDMTHSSHVFSVKSLQTDMNRGSATYLPQTQTTCSIDHIQFQAQDKNRFIIIVSMILLVA